MYLLLMFLAVIAVTPSAPYIDVAPRSQLLRDEYTW